MDRKVLTDDVEGLTIMRDGGRTYLIASSQGDSTYPVWQVDGGAYTYKGRFAVEGGSIDNVTVTDGIDAWSGPIGPYLEGAIAMHDTDDGDGRQQNYKLMRVGGSTRVIRAASGAASKPPAIRPSTGHRLSLR